MDFCIGDIAGEAEANPLDIDYEKIGYTHFERDGGEQDDFYEQKTVFVDADADLLQMRIQENRVSSLNLYEQVRLRCTCIS